MRRRQLHSFRRQLLSGVREGLCRPGQDPGGSHFITKALRVRQCFSCHFAPLDSELAANAGRGDWSEVRWFGRLIENEERRQGLHGSESMRLTEIQNRTEKKSAFVQRVDGGRLERNEIVLISNDIDAWLGRISLLLSPSTMLLENSFWLSQPINPAVA